jgi:large subunit ribosomal protein L6
MPIAGEIIKLISIPNGVTVDLVEAPARRGIQITVKGPKGTLTREFIGPGIEVTKLPDSKIKLYCKLPRRKDKALIGTWDAHIRNMLKGVTKGFEYELKIVYSHFPIRATVKDDEVRIDNFLGEKHPRTAKIVGDTKVKVSGDQVLVTGINKEAVGQTAANIELATRIKGYDPRVFQDGIYIVNKGREK